MGPNELASSIKRDWIAIVVFVVFLTIGIAGWLTKSGGQPALPPPVETVIGEGKSLGATVAVSPAAVRESSDEKTKKTIGEYQAKLDADPQSPDAPALLFAMGNLNRQKFVDYNEAARCYALLIHDYPDWEGIAQVYIQLDTCYERLGKLDDRKYVLEKMMERYPEDSQEYLYAKSTLSPSSVPRPLRRSEQPETSAATPDTTTPSEESSTGVPAASGTNPLPEGTPTSGPAAPAEGNPA